MDGPVEIFVEYILGFTLGWTIFQALFMRDMAGGSYTRSLNNTFVPELLSMNLLMAGMVPVAMTLKRHMESAGDPTMPVFWFVMSLALLVGFITSYPMNWWLVRYHLKHGMMTVRPADASTTGHDHATHSSAGEAPAGGQVNDMDHTAPPRPSIPVMAPLSFVALATGFALAQLF